MLHSRLTIFLFIAVLFFSCKHSQGQAPPNTYDPKVVEAHGYIVPADSMAPPVLIPVDENKLKKIPAGKPRVIPVHSNEHTAGTPAVVLAAPPRVCTPGQDTFAYPKVVKARISPFMPGIPEVITAKDAENKGCFASLGKLQGLKAGTIEGVLEDKNGNLWFATHFGAVKFDGRSFTYLTEKEGLCSRDIACIREDRFGNLWFGTSGGATEYDGKAFTNFTQKEGLCNNSVNVILEDKRGNFWFGTDNGVSEYDGKAFTSFTEKEGLCNNVVSGIAEDSSGNIWLGTTRGISKWDGKSFMNFTAKDCLGDATVFSVAKDKGGNIWFGENGEVLQYDGKSFRRFTGKEGMAPALIMSMAEDRNGNHWFGSNGAGVSKYNGKSFTDFTEKEGLSNNHVLYIIEDKRGGLGFATWMGLSEFEGKTFTNFTEKDGLISSEVQAILGDRKGNLWLATSLGVSRYDGKSYANFTEKEGLCSTYVTCMLEDRSGNIWFGTDAGISRYDGKTFTNFTMKDGLCSDLISSVFEDKRGNIWFGATDCISEFNGKSFTSFTSGLDAHYVHAIAEDKNGNFWFGTSYGAAKYDGKSLRYFTEKDGLCGDFVQSIQEDKSGNIWFGTTRGLSRYDGKSFVSVTEKEGLCSNIVVSILLDKSGNLWFGTFFGLSMLSLASQNLLAAQINNNIPIGAAVLFKTYNRENGFAGLGCNYSSIGQTADSTVWIGTNNMLTAYHPDGDIPDTIPPHTEVTNIALYNENIDWQNLLAPENRARDTSFLLGNGVRVGNFTFDDVSKWYGLPQHLSLAYNNNYLTFRFVGITTKSPKKVKYKYKLEGLDENWSALTSGNEAHYGNLPNGTFTFTVKAMNSEGYWSNEYHYIFTIRPPWWKTWWFRTLIVLFIIGSVAFYIKWRERALKERQKVLERTVEERTAEVVAEKREVEKQKEQVEKEKERSEELLLNILPGEVAEELKAKGSADAKYFDDVTVLFTDFKGFTTVSERLTPQQLVDELHACFSAFDAIMAKYNIEKIKTVGDAYLAVSGLPLAHEKHAEKVVEAAIEIRDFMLTRRNQLGEKTFEIRIGVHSGNVVAGIVGVKKFAYDIWGDTVNTAARMEQNSVAGKINISQTTYELVKDKFTCEYRGEIEAKNKGKLNMYFVN